MVDSFYWNSIGSWIPTHKNLLLAHFLIRPILDPKIPLMSAFQARSLKLAIFVYLVVWLTLMPLQRRGQSWIPLQRRASLWAMMRLRRPFAFTFPLRVKWWWRGMWSLRRSEPSGSRESQSRESNRFLHLRLLHRFHQRNSQDHMFLGLQDHSMQAQVHQG